MVDTDVTARATCEVLRVDGIRRDRILLDCVSFTYQEAAGSHLRTGTLLAYFLSKSRRERPSDRLLLLFSYRNGLGKLATGARWVKLFVEIMRDRSGWSVLWSDSVRSEDHAEMQLVERRVVTSSPLRIQFDTLE